MTCEVLHQTVLSYKSLYSIISVLYIPIVFLINKYIKKFNLNIANMAWNGIASIYSLITFLCLADVTLQILIQPVNVCNDELYDPQTPRIYYAINIFFLSKIAEMIDTILLALRKKPINVLHVYHHISVYLYAWFLIAKLFTCDKTAYNQAIVFCALNSFVHFVMYGYYFIGCIDKKIYKYAKILTVIQLIQFIIGLITIILAAPCTETVTTVFSGFIYASYLLLFARYFLNRYFKTRGSKID